MLDRSHLIPNFLEKNNISQNYQLVKVAGDASFRSYYRAILDDNKSYIIMDAPPVHEDIKPFCKIDEFLVKHHFSAPKIFARDDRNGFLLLEDFGDLSYSKVLKNLLGDDLLKKEEQLYKWAIEALFELHKIKELPEGLPLYNEELLMREVMLLVDWYLPHIKQKTLNQEEIAQFQNLWRELFNGLSKPSKLVLRDYHADNLMLIDDRIGYKKVGLLDFQDAVIGSAAYDLVSLLEDARRDVAPENIEKIFNYYLDRAADDKSQLIYDYQVLSLQRNIKIVGIFARLAYRDGKQHYLNYLPRVFGHVNKRLEDKLFSNLKNFLSIYLG